MPLLAQLMGIPVTLTMPENASPERVSILRALGAEVMLTDPLEGSDGAILVARKMAAENPELYLYANQYDNPANWQAHYYSTGPEIWSQTNGQVTHFIAGLGTSGTLTGVGKYLREMNPDVQIIAMQPDDAFPRPGRVEAYADRYPAGHLSMSILPTAPRSFDRRCACNGPATGARGRACSWAFHPVQRRWRPCRSASELDSGHGRDRLPGCRVQIFER